MIRAVEMHDAPAMMREYDQHGQRAASERRHGDESIDAADAR